VTSKRRDIYEIKSDIEVESEHEEQVNKTTTMSPPTNETSKLKVIYETESDPEVESDHDGTDMNEQNMKKQRATGMPSADAARAVKQARRMPSLAVSSSIPTES